MKKSLLLVGLILAAGCSGTQKPQKKELEVTGKVMLSSGTALEKGFVAFDPILASGAAREETAKIDQGTFKVKIMPGRYRVAIDPAEQRGNARPGVADKYTKCDTSGLEVEVVEGKELVITIQ
ncbi:hypothetical protein BH11PLA2_BH11PLA2_12930 [soil metagenome]